MAVREGFWYRLLLRLVPLLYGIISRLLFGSCRVTVHGGEHLASCDGKSFIAAFWHYSVFCIIEMQRRGNRRWVAMVSASRDAEFVARVLAREGCRTVRGSRNRGSVKALREMMVAMEGGLAGAIVADGSQGPALVAQPGAVLLASRSGAPILPVVVAADRFFVFRSWDRTMLPKPFARLALCYGEPLAVPPDLKSSELEPYRQQLEERLNALYRQAWGRLGREGH
ncbi:MAG: lysophospholipid acyltransferase family protein [Desulfobulbaceae bacterium]|nr:lysophospholipid acyltransferase family protein [Desulfobulbaceae bacterium]